MARHRGQKPSWLWVVPSLLIPLAIAAVAWTDHVGSEGHEIAPNVKFAGLDLSGLDTQEAGLRVREREADFSATPITFDLGERQIAITAGELGFDYMFLDTVERVTSARHGPDAVSEFFSWVTTPFRTLTIEDQYRFDTEIARARLLADDFILAEPVEPVVTNGDNNLLYIEPGSSGEGIDLDSTLAAMSALPVEDGPITLTPLLVEIKPAITNGEAASLAIDLNVKTRGGLQVAVRDVRARLHSGQIRSHLFSTVEDGVMTVQVDADGLQAELESAFPAPIGQFNAPELEVFDGTVIPITPGQAPPVCCDPESVAAAASTILNGAGNIYRFRTRTDDDPTALAWADGSFATELVAEFTTRHPCCQNRVTNIQTMAEALTGVYLFPGDTLSLNEFVGPRTREKGYLPAGAIRGGYMTDEVGGGVSQFVTTMFNAAFFAGLELDEYRSHSVYFSRYPFGREATLSIPGPDLVVTNTTDYPVLIWPTYDANSITVSLYSTQHIQVEELEQRISRRGQCRHSEIDRQRTYPDGRVVVDTIVADYRPADGLDCSGNAIPRG